MKIIDNIRLLLKNKLLPFVVAMKPKQKFLVFFCSVVLLLWIVKISVNIVPSHPKQLQPQEDTSEELVASPESEVVQNDKPDKNGWPYYTAPIRTWNDPEFNDLQDAQMASAVRNGLKRRISNRKQAEEEVAKGDLVFMGANPLFYMDDLTHSIPYLVPKAYRLLNRIGVNFIDSLASKKLPAHALIVTSVLRTENDINKLQKRNGNATSNSCHLFATTFDISWRKFKELGVDPQNSQHTMEQELALKNALGEVLRDLRYEGRCYVKHEKNQSCFHITVR